MSSLIDLASLVVAPTAVKDGKVYNAIPNDQDFTFSRGTEATRVNSAGLIEKARTNLLLQSNTFDTTWAKSVTATLTSGQTGYDGSSDAWLFGKDATGFINLNQAISTLSGVGTLSIYAKANTNSNIIVRCIGGTDAQGFFDLSNGTLAAPSVNCISAEINAVGNGWYRCSITFNTSSTTSVNLYPDYPFGGLNAGSIYIQDAQLEQGLVATDVITTTTSSVTVGITDDLPRVDYSGGGCPSLLLEPSRTNLVTHSEYLDAWTKSGCTIANNESTSPEGVDNASKFIASSGLSVKIAYQIISSTNSVAHTVSAFYKSDEYNYAFLRVGGQSPSPYVIYNLSNQSIVSTANATSTKIEDYGSGWYRVSMTYMANNTTNAVNVSFLPTSGYSLDSVNQPSYYGDGSSGGYVYGVQLESSASYVSSYIPTYGTSTSRSADSCSLTGASNLIGQTEGTMFVEYDQNLIGQGVTRRIMALTDGTTSNRIVMYITSSSKIDFYVRNSSGQLFLGQSANINTKGVHKIAAAYKDGDYIVYLDGVEIISGSGTSGTIPACNRIDVGSQLGANDLFEPINQAILFPTRLTNDQLAELTK